MANIWDEFDKNIDTDGLQEDIKNAAENGGNFKEVPPDTYEVSIEKLELVKSKSGSPMVSCWMKILAGEYKNSRMFLNQVITRGFQVHKCNEFIRQLVSGMENPLEIQFKTYKQYGNLLMDVMEEIDGNYEYAVKFTKNDKGYAEYTVIDVYVLE